jgi:hypothetical protein
MKARSTYQKKTALEGFLSDWREVFVISRCYGMGDPLARSSTMPKKVVYQCL